jgi:5-methylcytosine-specific restriction endonuclease McrA
MDVDGILFWKIMKKCITCKTTAPESDFLKDTRYKDGTANVCVRCRSEYSRNWRKENKERYQNYILQTRDHILERLRNWRIDNKEHTKKYKNEHSENDSQYRRNRRARIKGNGGKVTAKEWKDLCNQYENKCLCCGCANLELTLDHVIPLSLGGENSINNAQPLCRSCNSKKFTKIIDYR